MKKVYSQIPRKMISKSRPRSEHSGARFGECNLLPEQIRNQKLGASRRVERERKKKIDDARDLEEKREGKRKPNRDGPPKVEAGRSRGERTLTKKPERTELRPRGEWIYQMVYT